MLQGMSSPILGCIKNCVYAIFRIKSKDHLERRGSQISVQCFNTTTLEWSFRAPLPNGITVTLGACAVTLQDMLYVVGAMLCLRYDQSENAWTVLARPRELHMCCAAMALNNKVIICGGVKAARPIIVMSDTIEEYDPVTNTWRFLPVKLPKPLVNHFIAQA